MGTNFDVINVGSKYRTESGVIAVIKEIVSRVNEQGQNIELYRGNVAGRLVPVEWMKNGAIWDGRQGDLLQEFRGQADVEDMSAVQYDPVNADPKSSPIVEAAEYNNGVPANLPLPVPTINMANPLVEAIYGDLSKGTGIDYAGNNVSIIKAGNGYILLLDGQRFIAATKKEASEVMTKFFIDTLGEEEKVEASKLNTKAGIVEQAVKEQNFKEITNEDTENLKEELANEGGS